jgi:phosphatidylserine synthase
MRSRIVSWADKHLLVPRWILTFVYVQFAVLGLALAIGGSPAIDFTTPRGFLTPWAAALTLGAVLAAVGSRRPTRLVLELIGSTVLCGCLLVYAYAAWNTALTDPEPFTVLRVAGPFAITILTDLPLIQLAYLVTQVGRRPALSTPPPAEELTP